MGGVGYDYELFLPWLLSGFYWQHVNGWASIPAYVPSFCGGVPLFFNPQSMVVSLPQWLMLVLPPVQSLLVSWIAFGLAGGAAMYALLRTVFRTSQPAALLGATLFLLNGFYTTRMIIGHATYHGFMLLPVIALALFHPTGRLLPRALVIAVGLAYLFYSGGTNIILPMALGLLLLSLRLWQRRTLMVAATGCALGVALCAAKLLPALAFTHYVVRPVALRMTPNLPALLGGSFVSLFVPQVLGWLNPDRFVVDRVELEYGVGLVPLLALGLAAFRLRPLGPMPRKTLLAGAVLLAVPILVNYDGPGLRWLLLHIPIMRAMSVMLRFWAAYIPLLCVATAMLLDRLVSRAPTRIGWAAAGIALTIAQTAATDMRHYANQPYDPQPIEAAWEAVRHGDPVPPITRIGPPPPAGLTGDAPFTRRNDGLIDGVSDLPCYEPMFGNRLSVFMQGAISPGPVLAAQDGRLNLKNPTCYVFPGANACAPGEEFTAAQADAAQAFAEYRPFPYRWPASQYAATALTAAAALFCLVVLLVGWL